MIGANNYYAFKFAAQNGHLDVLRYLEEKAPDKLAEMIGASDYRAFKLAAQNGPTSAGLGVSQTSGSFLSAMSNPYRAAPGSFAFAAADGHYITPAADVITPDWKMWGVVLGGGGQTSGNTDIGSSDVTSYGYGLATGWEKNVSPNETRGFSIAGGGTDWDIADDMGGGNGTFLQLGVNANKFFSANYVSASASYGFHNMESSRTVEDQNITADFNMHTLASRLEAGHMLSANLTPYAALQVQPAVVGKWLLEQVQPLRLRVQRRPVGLGRGANHEGGHRLSRPVPAGA